MNGPQKNSHLNNLREGDRGGFSEYVDVGWLVLGLVDLAAVLFVMAPWVVLTDKIDVVVECDGTVAVCCIASATGFRDVEDGDGCVVGVDEDGCDIGVDEDGCDVGVDEDGCVVGVDQDGCVVGVDEDGCVVEVDEDGCVVEVDEDGCVVEVDEDGCDVGVDEDGCVVGVDDSDEFVGSTNVNWITSTIQRNPRSIVV